MHVAFGQFSTALADDAPVHVTTSLSGEVLPFPSATVDRPSRYGQQRSVNWPGIAIVILLHIGLFAALAALDVVPLPSPKKTATVVEMIELPMDPPPAAAPPPPQTIEPVQPDMVRTPIVAPPPVVKTNAAATPVLAAPQPAPVEPAPAKSASPAPTMAAPAPAAQGPVSGGDLSSKMISFEAPKYPLDARKKKQEGIVILSLLLDNKGGVEEIAVSKSSGFPTLDKAALQAVRKWRWSPTVRAGEPVQVRGLVKIPFMLRS